MVNDESAANYLDPLVVSTWTPTCSSADGEWDRQHVRLSPGVNVTSSFEGQLRLSVITHFQSDKNCFKFYVIEKSRGSLGGFIRFWCLYMAIFKNRTFNPNAQASYLWAQIGIILRDFK